MSLPESIDSPPAALSSLVPGEAQARVTVGPAPEWVRPREVDESYRPPGSGAYAHLLIDCQYEATRRERFERHVQRLETLGAVQESSQWRLAFDPATQEVIVHSLVVRRAAVEVEHAQTERFRFMQREEQLDRQVLHGKVSIVVLLEDVRPGDILDASYTVRHRPRLLGERFWFFNVIPSAVPLRSFHLSVHFPESHQMAWKAHSADFAPAEEKLEGERRWEWTMENTVAVETEAGVPAWQLPPLWVQVSDCASWQEVIACLLAAWREDLTGAVLTRVAAEIAEASATPAERAGRALSFVQDEIRYLSVNIELGGQIPSQPGQVLRRRFGDCKDKSFLLAHLLRRLGLPARPVLVNTTLRQSVQKLLPTPDIFDHVVVEYELEGRRRWADATLPLQGGSARERPAPDLRMGLPLSPDATGLEEAPPLGRYGAYELRETYVLDTTGRPSQLTVVITARGWEAEQLRRSLLLQGVEAVAKSREQFYRNFYEVRRLSAMEWRDDRAQNVLVLAESYELPSAVVRFKDGQHAVFPCRAHLIELALSLPDVQARRQPLALKYPCRLEHRLEIVSPSLPRQFVGQSSMRTKSFDLQYEATQTQGRWAIVINLEMKRDYIPSHQFPRYKRELQALWGHLQFQFLLQSGIASPWRKRASWSSLPPAKTGLTPLPVEETPPEERCLSAEPAPALTSPPRPAAEPTVAPEEDTEAPDDEKVPAKKRAESPKRPDPPPRIEPEQPYRSRRSRRSKIDWAMVIAIVGLLLFVAFWAIVLTQLS